jgi:flagellar protein FliL
MAMTDDEEEAAESVPAPPPPRMSTLTFITVVAVLTALAGGGGFVLGLQILTSVEQGAHSKQNPAGASPVEVQPLSTANVKVLSPIMANLAGTPRVWMRLESSLLFRDEVPRDADALSAMIAEDIVAFLRTVSVKQIEGASGFQHLCEDLNDRVRVRSGGRVQELIVQGMIVE